MLSVHEPIYGWSPTGGDDEDVNVSPDMRFMMLPGSSNAFVGSICPPLSTSLKTRSPKSLPTSKPSIPLTGATHTSIAPSSDRRAQRNRNRDPSWIPRPRNAFIIFRCEYSREHTQGSQEPQSDDESVDATVKSLSKRAAEAWKQLPARERDRYKVLADQEREQHARLYPHYRFRPMKRQVSGPRKSSPERSQGPRVPSVERRPPSLSRVPSVLAPAPEKPRSSPSVEQSEEPSSTPLWTALSPSETLLYPVDPQTEHPGGATLSVDCHDAILSCSLHEATLRPDSTSPVELYTPVCMSADSIPPEVFRCHDSMPSIDLACGDAEREQALEAYAIGLYNYDLFSPFSFPEYY